MSVEDALRGLSQLDRIVHEPVRLSVMAHLSLVVRADFIFLMRELGVTQGNLSQHMSKLEEAGYVEVEKTIVYKKMRTTFRLTEAGRKAFRGYVEALRRGLDALPG